MKFWNFKAAAGAGKAPELRIYGDIGDWMDVDSKRFAADLAALGDVPELAVRINSDGGSVFTAQAIYSMLRRHAAAVTVYIDGIAASAATIIAMAGDRIVMPANAMMMIHNPLTGLWGNANDMREMADLLDKIRETLLAVYREKTGLSDEKLVELLDAETYLTAAEAVELGFATEVEESLRIAASLSRTQMVVNGLTLDHERHGKMPETWLNQAPTNTQTAGPAGQPEEKERQPMNLEQLKAEHPDLFRAVRDEGVQAGQAQERARIQAIEELAIGGHEQLIAEAKFKTGVTAEAVAVALIKAEKAQKDKFLADRQNDAGDVNNVDPASGEDDKEAKAKAQDEAVIAAAAQAFTARAGRKI